MNVLVFVPVITWALRSLFPKAPEWVATFVGSVFPAVVELVDSFKDLDEFEGAQKFEFVVGTIRTLVDDALDPLPLWGEKSEDERDRLIGGLVEWAYFIHQATERAGKTSSKADDRLVKDAFKTLKQGLRRSL